MSNKLTQNRVKITSKVPIYFSLNRHLFKTYSAPIAEGAAKNYLAFHG